MAERKRREYIDAPPDYRKSDERYPGEDGRPGRRKPNRRLKTSPSIRRRGARPQGGPAGRLTQKERDREEADRFGQWAPGEFQRSYPKNKKNAEWYRTHTYGRSAGDDYDSWRRIAGPPTPKGKPKPRKGPGDWHKKKKKKAPRGIGASRMLARAAQKNKKKGSNSG